MDKDKQFWLGWADETGDADIGGTMHENDVICIKELARIIREQDGEIARLQLIHTDTGALNAGWAANERRRAEAAEKTADILNSSCMKLTEERDELRAENKALKERLDRAENLLSDALPHLSCEDMTQSNLITAIGEFVDALRAYKEE